MKTSTLLLTAALGAGALWAFQRYIDRKLSGTGQGSQPPRNDAAGPRLPAMPAPPGNGATPNAPGWRSWPNPGEKMVEVGGSGWRELNQHLINPGPLAETTGWIDRTSIRNANSDDVARIFDAWQSIQ